jgi:transposase
VADEERSTHVPTEVTGVYWKPVSNILSDGMFELMLANLRTSRTFPAARRIINDGTWTADLLSCGLIKASFVSEQQTQELRSPLRARKQLTREQTSSAAHSGDAGRGQHQAGLGDHRHHGRPRRADDRGDNQGRQNWPNSPTAGSRRAASSCTMCCTRLTAHHLYASSVV